MGQELIASGEQQEQLIEALLTLATSARGLEQHEPFDLSEITADVLLGPTPRSTSSGSTSRPPSPPHPRSATHVWPNASSPTSSTTPSATTSPAVTSTSRREPKPRQAVLTITNSGPIIPQDDIDRLFQPFQRLDRGRANHHDGHGLGLSIVQAIAAAHGATLTAHPVPEGGLSVSVTFPAPATPTQPARQMARK